MALILRNIKGSALNYNELDNNFTYLETLAEDAISSSPLSDILSNGNESDGNDLIISVGDTLTISGTISVPSNQIDGYSRDLSQILEIGTKTLGKNIEISNADTFIQGGKEQLKYRPYTSSTTVDSNFLCHHLNAASNNVILTNFTSPVDGQLIEFLRIDGSGFTARVDAVTNNFVVGGTTLTTVPLLFGTHYRFQFSSTTGLWFNVV